MPTDSGNEDSGESPQYALRQEETENSGGKVDEQRPKRRGRGCLIAAGWIFAILVLIALGTCSDISDLPRGFR